MGSTPHYLVVWLLVLSAMAGPAAVPAAYRWRRLPSIPDRKGLAGLFSGVSGGSLLVAGGANFPKKPPWEGGRKEWRRGVYALRSPAGRWEQVGRLPRPLGYGVSASYDDRIICVGGSDQDRHYAEVISLRLRRGKLETRLLPSLPVPVANGCGALVGSVLYVAGGQSEPTSFTASNRVFAMDLAMQRPVWRELPPLPGPGRILSAAASAAGEFWVIGGASLSPGPGGKATRRYLRDGFRYKMGRGWNRIVDLPTAMAAAPSPAPVDVHGIYLLGGDDGSRAGQSPQGHPGFSRQLLRYGVGLRRWRVVGAVPAPRVTASTAKWLGSWVIASGEVRPGVRSPQVWSFAP